MKSVEEWKSVLRAALKAAMRERRAHAVSVLRETLGAIDNAEAADSSAASPAQAGVIAGGVAGLGAGEVARRVLKAEEVNAIIERELEERREAIATLSALGRTEEVDRLQQQLEVLTAVR